MKAVARRFVVAAAVLVSCDKKPLQNADGSGGIGVFDGGLPSNGGDDGGGPAWGLDAGAFDGVAIAGVRSFVVTSKIQHHGSPSGPIPSAHTFTMVLDADQGIAIFGAGGEVRTATFSPEAGGYRVTGRFLFSAGWQSCSSVTYTDIRVAIDGSGRLVGAGAGEAVSVGGVILPATMSLSGVADRQGATLAIAGASNDPFAAFSVAASEPLPKAARVMLRAPDGETIPLEASGTARGFAATFSKPRVLLRYATQYQVVASDLADLAGNPPIAVGGLVFTTLPRPPLVAEDGFESLADGSTFGGALVLSGSGEPVIAGAKSLYVPVYNSVNTALPVPLVLRLPVGAGDTVVRFSYRAVNGVSGEATYAMGKEGNTIITIGLIDDPVAQTPGTIRGSQVMFGPLRTATVPLPPGTPTDTATEIMFQRSVQPWYGCGSTPAPSIVGGVIIDDLRVE